MGFYPATANQTVSGNLTVNGGATITGALDVSGGGAFFGPPNLTMNTAVMFNGSDTFNSAPALTPAFANGTAGQLSDNTRDYMIYFTVTLAGTLFTVKIGPTSSPADTIIPSSSVSAGQVVSFRLPAAWFCEWSATTATISQAAIGC